MLIRRRPCEKVKRGGRQRVLVGAPVDVRTHQLLGCGVGDCSHGEIGRGESADVTQLSPEGLLERRDASAEDAEQGRHRPSLQNVPTRSA
jgi:hypothetical protein